MKKTGKSGLGHRIKLEKTSKNLAAGRAVLAMKQELSRRTSSPRRFRG